MNPGMFISGNAHLKARLADGKKYVVCLTFDFDAISGWISMGRKTPGYLSRGEFGAKVGARRVLDLLQKFEIRSTWFVPGHTAETYPEVTKEVSEHGHEIAHHGYVHESTSNLSEEEERNVLLRGIQALESVTGKRPLGYRSPSWDFTRSTVKLLAQNGFVYDSSLMADDYTPYMCRDGDFVDDGGRMHFGKQVNLIEFPVSWSLDDWPHFEYFRSEGGMVPGLRSASDVYENWRADFDYMRRHLDWGVYTITFHPQVIGRGHRMILLEKLVKYFRSFSNVRFSALIDVARQLCREPGINDQTTKLRHQTHGK